MDRVSSVRNALLLNLVMNQVNHSPRGSSAINDVIVNGLQYRERIRGMVFLVILVLHHTIQYFYIGDMWNSSTT